MRGFLARKKVYAVYGFQSSTLGGRRKKQQLQNVDPAQLKLQRERVQQIKASLPPFEYDRPGDHNNHTGTQREARQKISLPDGETYEGEWDI